MVKNCLIAEGFGIQSGIPDYHMKYGHLNTGQVKVCYSDFSVIQMLVIQIPTVIEFVQSGISHGQFWRISFVWRHRFRGLFIFQERNGERSLQVTIQ